MRNFNRKHDEIRNVAFATPRDSFAEGSCLITLGKTQVICNATVEYSTPKWLNSKKSGWITAEYCMLPRATEKRNNREITLGKKSSRSSEIQRLIGRSIRSVVDLEIMPGMQIFLDCDVLLADGGTRTASINGAFIALSKAIRKLIKRKVISSNPIKSHLAAISCGIVENTVLLDLDYDEDSKASVDANFVFDSNLNLCEVQVSAEKKTFSESQFIEMLNISKKGVSHIFKLQNQVLDE